MSAHVRFIGPPAINAPDVELNSLVGLTVPCMVVEGVCIIQTDVLLQIIAEKRSDMWRLWMDWRCAGNATIRLVPDGVSLELIEF